MNALLNKFPQKVNLKGTIFNLNTDFRVGLNIIMMYEDNSLTIYEKTDIMLELLYKGKIPDELKDVAIEKAMLFLDRWGE